MAFRIHNDSSSAGDGLSTGFPVVTIPETKLQGTLFSLLRNNTSDPVLAKLQKEVDSLDVQPQRDLAASTGGDISRVEKQWKM